jgi:hypothetical protein
VFVFDIIKKLLVIQVVFSPIAFLTLRVLSLRRVFNMPLIISFNDELRRLEAKTVYQRKY